jgi:hypothetical protein
MRERRRHDDPQAATEQRTGQHRPSTVETARAVNRRDRARQGKLDTTGRRVTTSAYLRLASAASSASCSAFMRASCIVLLRSSAAARSASAVKKTKSTQGHGAARLKLSRARQTSSSRSHTRQIVSATKLTAATASQGKERTHFGLLAQLIRLGLGGLRIHRLLDSGHGEAVRPLHLLLQTRLLPLRVPPLQRKKNSAEHPTRQSYATTVQEHQTQTLPARLRAPSPAPTASALGRQPDSVPQQQGFRHNHRSEARQTLRRSSASAALIRKSCSSSGITAYTENNGRDAAVNGTHRVERHG